MALTNQSIEKDFVNLFIEMPDYNKISINELRVSSKNLPPYKFSYELVQWREYTGRQRTWTEPDPITTYRQVFTKEGMHVGVAVRASG